MSDYIDFNCDLSYNIGLLFLKKVLLRTYIIVYSYKCFQLFFKREKQAK